ncbi:MAG: CDP-diacylglycerol--glycerol-3-phosphate 3-phosphatidyltransferase [Candidatus Omnitrophota bacterium]|nr:CDP-diacylglycerol--glycerol-3-phosphate 3-phosphatidyltransferase [Candidatus Omnitrophota bacterium]
MNLPNRLTISRIILTLFFIIFISLKGLGPKVVAFIVFIIASLTDYYDGYLARRNNQITDFGKLMDPIADKILILSAFLAFVQMQLISAWMVVVIFSREALITGLRLFAINKGKVLEAEAAGKHKTASQMVAIFLIFIFIIFKETLLRFYSWGNTINSIFRISIFVLMLITVGLTIISGLSYLWRNRHLIHV